MFSPPAEGIDNETNGIQPPAFSHHCNCNTGCLWWFGGSGASVAPTRPGPITRFTQDGPLNPYALAARLNAPVTMPQSSSAEPSHLNGSVTSTPAAVPARLNAPVALPAIPGAKSLAANGSVTSTPAPLTARLHAPVALPPSPGVKSVDANGSAASTTAVVSGVIADTVPGAGIIFGPISVLAGAFGSNAEDAHLQDQIDAINATLVSIQNQINALQTQITKDNALYNDGASELVVGGARGVLPLDVDCEVCATPNS